MKYEYELKMPQNTGWDSYLKHAKHNIIGIVRLYVRPFVRLPVYSFVHSFVCGFVSLCVCVLVRSCVRVFVRLCVCAFDSSDVCAFFLWAFLRFLIVLFESSCV